MRMSLRPMMFLALSCTGCGRFLSKPKEAATDEEISKHFALVANPEMVAEVEAGSVTKICKKCGRPFTRRKNNK